MSINRTYGGNTSGNILRIAEGMVMAIDVGYAQEVTLRTPLNIEKKRGKTL